MEKVGGGRVATTPFVLKKEVGTIYRFFLNLIFILCVLSQHAMSVKQLRHKVDLVSCQYVMSTDCLTIDPFHGS